VRPRGLQRSWLVDVIDETSDRFGNQPREPGHAMPPRDTKELAHSLINRPGSNERPLSVSVYLVIRHVSNALHLYSRRARFESYLGHRIPILLLTSISPVDCLHSVSN
jgi:hypothetical protein